jgi:hypothetical protein
MGNRPWPDQSCYRLSKLEPDVIRKQRMNVPRLDTEWSRGAKAHLGRGTRSTSLPVGSLLSTCHEEFL